MMKRVCTGILVVFISISLILFSKSLYLSFFSKGFNVSNVMQNISYLSSDQFKGRLAGTTENSLTAEYIKNQFTDLGLLPFRDNSYYQEFQCIYPKKIEGSPSLCVKDADGKVIKTYSYGKDYKDVFQNFAVSNNTFYGKASLKGKNGSMFVLQSEKGTALFLSPENDDFSFRSSFIYNSKYDLYVYLSRSVMNEILNYLNENCSVSVSFPYINEETCLKNVVATIKGSDNTLPPLVIGAHYDHVGTTLDNEIYNGALDNASGTSFVLELARYMKSLGTPKRTIIFVIFNAEEFGLRGSKAFADENLDALKGGQVFNFDMIGSDDGIPLCIIEGRDGKVTDKAVEDFIASCKSHDVHYNCMFEDSSDHASFSNNGIDAATICDDDINRIHIPRDTIEYIKPSAIERCFTVINPILIEESGFTEYYLIEYNYIILPLTALCTAFSITVIIVINKKTYRNEG